MTTREEMAEVAFETWWAAMPPERANELAACGEQIRSGLKAAVKLGYVAARTRDGELRERLAAYANDLLSSNDPEESATKHEIGATIAALLKEFP